MFGLFRTKKGQPSLNEVLGGFAVYQNLMGQVAKIQSLRQLNRSDEASQLFDQAEASASNYARKQPRDKHAQMMLALLYNECGHSAQAEPIMQRLLDFSDFALTVDERLIVTAELQKLLRQQPASERPDGVPEGFTEVYCCASCGRLHNFLTMPCPHCDWSPQSLEEMAASMVLCSSGFKIPQLLALAREITNGRKPSDVVLNLATQQKGILSNHGKSVQSLLELLRKNEHKNHRSLAALRQCPSCGKNVFFSGAEECEQCNAPINWPPAVRALVCMDNLLWLLEQRIEPTTNPAFSEFVCILVAMTNGLLRNQESPSAKDRGYAVDLLAKMNAIFDVNNGATIETTKPQELKMYLIQDRMRDDSRSFGLFIHRELEIFVDAMSRGLQH